MEMTTAPESKTFKKVFLICHPGALGDFILTWPCLLSLRAHYQEHRFIAVGRGEHMKLAARFGLIDGYFDVDSRDSVSFFAGQSLPPGMDQPDGAVLWMKHSDPIQELLQETSSLPVLFIDPIINNSVHVLEHYFRNIGDAFSVKIPNPIFQDFPEHAPKSRYAFIHPGSGSERKNFNPDLYKNIAFELGMNGYDKIAFLMGPAEIERGLPDLFRKEEIIFPENVDSLADWLQNASIYIGNDSGVSHLAGFLGIPSIVLYKTTDPKIWGVVGRHVTLLSGDNKGSLFDKIQNWLQQNNPAKAPL